MSRSKVKTNERRVKRLKAYVSDHKPSRRDYHKQDPRNLGVRIQDGK